uniref:ATP synthase F0 subunit 8 n=1 Tax=Georissa bangueyensis TaxID=1882664 RepID=A0A1B2G3C5_9GAST|nr:ATP synthase F0 subunit 8 [Georissa bangueyensis]
MPQLSPINWLILVLLIWCVLLINFTSVWWMEKCLFGSMTYNTKLMKSSWCW